MALKRLRQKYCSLDKEKRGGRGEKGGLIEGREGKKWRWERGGEGMGREERVGEEKGRKGCGKGGQEERGEKLKKGSIEGVGTRED